MLNRYGHDTLWTKAALRNRCHPNVVAAYKVVYGTDKILAGHDRAAIMRPTAGVHGAAMDTEFKHPGLHLDGDPQSYCGSSDGAVREYLDGLMYTDDRDFTSENNAKHYVLNLISNREEDGGFQCVPMFGCSDWLRTWTPTQKWTSAPEPNGRYIFTPKAYADLGAAAVRVPCPEGTLLLFDTCLPHGTLPNHSSRPRAIQFLRYIPQATFSAKNAANRAAAVRRHCKAAGFVPDTPEQARVLYGDP